MLKQKSRRYHFYSLWHELPENQAQSTTLRRQTLKPLGHEAGKGDPTDRTVDTRLLL